MSSIVYVDDKADDWLASLPENVRQTFRDFDPKEEAKAAFEAASASDLWVFDFFYSDDRTQQIALDEDNGLSLFQKWRRLKLEERPPAALVSSDLESAVGSDISPGRGHILAQRASVEWVGEKSQATAEFLVGLADASNAIQKSIMAITSTDRAGDRPLNEEICLRLLNAPKESPWRTSAERQLDRARPPLLSSVSEPQAKARLLLAWLLHNVLPYPSFLISAQHAAARLGLKTESFALLSQAEANDLGRMLQAARYEGPLAASSPDKWWRAGIDDIVWGFSQGKVDYIEGLSAAAGAVPINMLDIEDPVVVSNPDLVETDEIASAKDCVRAQDEHFPPDVPPAWVKLADVRDHADLAEKVVFEDRELLNVHSQ
ncbi:hypothetical protein [Mesorhizobium sp. M1163]|uniref:hypothetical protein n=1 Tax=Mesorhizobium sp. M1163 TaxID=2957065 RepID=UPI00333554F3